MLSDFFFNWILSILGIITSYLSPLFCQASFVPTLVGDGECQPISATVGIFQWFQTMEGPHIGENGALRKKGRWFKQSKMGRPGPNL